MYRILRRHGLNRLPRKVGRRAVHTKRYNKQVPGHHVQVDVKFLSFVGKNNSPIKRYQYTAIDDATRIRALKVYPHHNQKHAIAFVEYVLEKFPFRVQSIRTDRGREFQAKFHWHVEDKGIRHVYIKPRAPQLNGKVERSHRTDQDEFYQLLEYVDDVDLNKKLAEWERFYNLTRPHAPSVAEPLMRHSENVYNSNIIMSHQLVHITVGWKSMLLQRDRRVLIPSVCIRSN